MIRSSVANRRSWASGADYERHRVMWASRSAMRMSAASRGTLPGLPSETLCGALVSCILRSLSWTSDRLTTLTGRVAVSHPWTTINAVKTWKRRQKESSQDFRHSFLSAHVVKKLGRASVTGTKENFRTESARLRQVLGRLPGEAAYPCVMSASNFRLRSGMFSLAPKTAASPEIDLKSAHDRAAYANPNCRYPFRSLCRRDP